MRDNWQLMLIASLPGSLLHIWAVLNATELMTLSAPGGASDFVRLGAWSARNGFATLLTLPVLTVGALLLYAAYGEHLPALPSLVQPPQGGQPPKPLRLDTMTAAARELLAAVSPRGEFRLVPRGFGAAVVAPGVCPNEDREFYSPVNREVSLRYRSALTELERAGLIERDGEVRRLSASGWPAARLLTRQELDRIAQRARPLLEPEQRLLRLIADCRQRYKVDKVVLRRDGSSMSAIFGNGQTVPVPDVCPWAELFPGQRGENAVKRFEELVAGIPEDYLAAQPDRRLGNRIVVSLTETGLRYLRCSDVVSGTMRGSPDTASAA